MKKGDDTKLASSPPDTDWDEGEELYSVDAVLDVCRHNRVTYLRTKWTGYPKDEASWEPLVYFQGFETPHTTRLSRFALTKSVSFRRHGRPPNQVSVRRLFGIWRDRRTKNEILGRNQLRNTHRYYRLKYDLPTIERLNPLFHDKLDALALYRRSNIDNILRDTRKRLEKTFQKVHPIQIYFFNCLRLAGFPGNPSDLLEFLKKQPHVYTNPRFLGLLVNIFEEAMRYSLKLPLRHHIEDTIKLCPESGKNSNIAINVAGQAKVYLEADLCHKNDFKNTWSNNNVFYEGISFEDEEKAMLETGNIYPPSKNWIEISDSDNIRFKVKDHIKNDENNHFYTMRYDDFTRIIEIENKKSNQQQQQFINPNTFPNNNDSDFSKFVADGVITQYDGGSTNQIQQQQHTNLPDISTSLSSTKSTINYHNNNLQSNHDDNSNYVPPLSTQLCQENQSVGHSDTSNHIVSCNNYSNTTDKNNILSQAYGSYYGSGQYSNQDVRPYNQLPSYPPYLLSHTANPVHESSSIITSPLALCPLTPTMKSPDRLLATSPDLNLMTPILLRGRDQSASEGQRDATANSEPALTPKVLQKEDTALHDGDVVSHVAVCSPSSPESPTIVSSGGLAICCWDASIPSFTETLHADHAEHIWNLDRLARDCNEKGEGEDFWNGGDLHNDLFLCTKRLAEIINLQPIAEVDEIAEHTILDMVVASDDELQSNKKGFLSNEDFHDLYNESNDPVRIKKILNRCGESFGWGIKLIRTAIPCLLRPTFSGPFDQLLQTILSHNAGVLSSSSSNAKTTHSSQLVSVLNGVPPTFTIITNPEVTSSLRQYSAVSHMYPPFDPHPINNAFDAASAASNNLSHRNNIYNETKRKKKKAISSSKVPNPPQFLPLALTILPPLTTPSTHSTASQVQLSLLSTLSSVPNQGAVGFSSAPTAALLDAFNGIVNSPSPTPHDTDSGTTVRVKEGEQLLQIAETVGIGDLSVTAALLSTMSDKDHSFLKRLEQIKGQNISSASAATADFNAKSSSSSSSSLSNNILFPQASPEESHSPNIISPPHATAPLTSKMIPKHSVGRSAKLGGVLSSNSRLSNQNEKPIPCLANSWKRRQALLKHCTQVIRGKGSLAAHDMRLLYACYLSRPPIKIHEKRRNSDGVFEQKWGSLQRAFSALRGFRAVDKDGMVDRMSMRNIVKPVNMRSDLFSNQSGAFVSWRLKDHLQAAGKKESSDRDKDEMSDDGFVFTPRRGGHIHFNKLRKRIKLFSGESTSDGAEVERTSKDFDASPELLSILKLRLKSIFQLTSNASSVWAEEEFEIHKSIAASNYAAYDPIFASNYPKLLYKKENDNVTTDGSIRDSDCEVNNSVMPLEYDCFLQQQHLIDIGHEHYLSTVNSTTVNSFLQNLDHFDRKTCFSSDIMDRKAIWEHSFVVSHLLNLESVISEATYIVGLIPPVGFARHPSVGGNFIVKTHSREYKVVRQDLLELCFPIGVRHFYDAADKFLKKLSKNGRKFEPEGCLIADVEKATPIAPISNETLGETLDLLKLCPRLFPLSAFLDAPLDF